MEAVPADVASGYDALARGAWADARVAFTAALERTESPEALEGLGLAAWWLDDVTTTFDARRRAFRRYRASGDRRGAARVATALGWDHLLAGDHAVCRGWLQRAHRLVDDLGPGSEAGWLAIFDAHLALNVDHDAQAAERASVRAASLGRDLGEVDLEMLGLAYQGLTLVTRGAVGDGMKLLDEATAAALSGEITDPDAAATCCCALISACELVYDYPRAAEWCHRLREMAEGWSYRLMLSACRTLYAGVLVWRGRWVEAEAELLTALRSLEASRPGEAAETVLRLAQLRCRQGRFEEAAALFARTEESPLQMQGSTPALEGRAELMLEQGQARAAGDLAERYLRAVGPDSRMDRAGGLELLARARALTGDLADAQGAASELTELAGRVATEPIQGAACMSAGAVAAAHGNAEAARRRFEDAADHYQRSGGVFHAARARLELSRTLTVLGRDAEAVTEARAAYRVFRELGAVHAAAGAAAALRELGTAAADTVELGGSHLTPREVEVLRLLVRGLSNQRIAEELFLSVRTVERHVCNIYDKLGMAGGAARAGATAFALSHGLT